MVGKAEERERRERKRAERVWSVFFIVGRGRGRGRCLVIIEE